jgi:2',3'-cyclic-nucleotide 2'-phosphodiesterase (5'-nucleotidase family)
MPLSATPTGALNLTPIGSITLAGAEISAYDAASKRFFVTSNVGLQIVDASNPAAPTLVSTIAIATLSATGGDVTSVATYGGIVAVSVPDAVKTNPGKVVFVNAATGAVLNSVTVGALPDSLTFTPNGKMVLVANEGEPLTTGGVTTDPNGSVSIIDISGGVASASVTDVGFTGFQAQQAALATAGVRFDAGTTVAQALEPEYIAVAADGTYAMVTLQENNAVAKLDLLTKTFTAILPLGTKNHGLADNAADFSDRDTPGSSNVGIISINPAPGVQGMYMPDAIASFVANGQTYFVTANEGDSYEAFGSATRADDIRVGAATLDAALVASIVNASGSDVYVDEASIKNTDNLGRLTVSKFGDTDGDGDLDKLLAYGARSFSIRDASGALVFDSGSVMERALKDLTPTLFNADNGVAADFDTRSDNKGPEPEGITVGTVNGRTYAFVALERAGGGVMTFDVTDPANVTLSDYERREGDISGEGIAFIGANASGNGKNLVALSSEISGTLTIFEATQTAAPAFTLQILSYYGESGLLGVTTAPIMGALIDRFDDQYANTLVLGEGDSFIPGPWLVGGADPSLNSIPGIGTTALGRPDIAIMNAFGTDASALGNHEFDLGSPVFSAAITAAGSGASAWVGAQFPHLSANLDFSADSSLRGIADATLGGTGTNAFAGKELSAIKGKIAPYAISTQGGEKVGLIGITTFDLLIKSSPNGTVPKDDGNAGTTDLQEVAVYVQNAVNALKAMGVNKIVMVDQLDTIERNQALAPLVSGIDIMVAGGGHERLGDANDTAVAFNGHDANFVGTFPIVTAGADGKATLIVTTDTEYTYLGRLVVDFDANGEIIVGNLNSTINGAYASTEATLQKAYGSTATAAQIIAGSTIGTQVKAITSAIDAVIASKDGNVFGYTNVYLEGDRVFGRTQEVNLGNITADANLEAAQDALPTGFMTSLKNGGGIRASVGSIAEDGSKVAPAASPVKAEGAISQLDIENALRFDNKLMVFDTTAQGLLNILNFAAGLSSSPTQQSGGYMQLGGLRVSYDPDNAAGTKVRNIAIIDDEGQIIARVVENGVVSADAPPLISMVTLSFTANGGDGYPIKANAQNFRYLLTDGTLSGAVDEALDFTSVAAATSVGKTLAQILGEQKAFQDYLTAHHATPATAYNDADTSAAEDERIQNLNQRTSDSVLMGEQVTGNAARNLIEGTRGDDTLNGMGGADTLSGDQGNDSLLGANGADSLVGGNGADTLSGGNGTDTLLGGAGNDLLLGNADADRLDGGAGSDVLRGGTGNDMLLGGADSDRLFGEAGADTLAGGLGADVLSGGAGADSYFFAGLGQGRDRLDFDADDRILVSAGGFSGLTAGVALTSAQLTLGTVAVGASAQFVYTAATGRLVWDSNGAAAGGAELIALLPVATVLTAADFAVIA